MGNFVINEFKFNFDDFDLDYNIMKYYQTNINIQILSEIIKNDNLS